MSRRFYEIAAAFVIVILSFLLVSQCGKVKDQAEQSRNTIQALTDTGKTYRNKLGQEVKEKALLLTEYGKLKELKDSMSQALVKVVNKHTLSATLFTTNTKGTITGKTDSVDIRNFRTTTDSAVRESLTVEGDKSEFPIYHSTIEDAWGTFEITAGKDSTRLDYSIVNKYQITHEWKSNGFFREKTPIVKVINLNPHTYTKELIGYSQKEPAKIKWWTILAVGVGIGAVGQTYLLWHLK